MPSLKPIPPATVDLLIHPEGDTAYRHFENGADHPFDRAATGFSPVNAWWLADAALLAYWDEGPGKAIWSSAGFASEFISDAGAQAYVAWTDTFAIVSFRGTEPNEFRDFLDIISLFPVPWVRDGRVHEGFLKQFNHVWPRIDRRLQGLSGRPVFFTGHSLGGALATLALDAFGRGQAYTVGSPLVGNRAFVAGFNRRHGERSFRYVNNSDLVTFIPPPGWLLNYAHVDRRKFIDDEGRVSDAGLSWFSALSRSGRLGLVRQFFEERAAGLLTILPRTLADHIPSHYAVHLWNDYARR